MEKFRNYEDFIRSLDVRCHKSVVCIRINSADKQLLSVGTGIVVASEDHSCIVMTSANFINNRGGSKTNVAVVQFFDGTVHQVDWRYCHTRKEITVICIYNIPIRCDVVEFSANKAMEGQKVFTIGYNYNMPNRRFISGDIVCGADIIYKEANQFAHGCSTGKHGHQGSAVFNEARQFVGMNVFYTRSKRIDYSDDNASAIGGLVSALDLQTIDSRLQYICFKAEDKSLDQALQHLQNVLRQGPPQ